MLKNLNFFFQMLKKILQATSALQLIISIIISIIIMNDDPKVYAVKLASI